MKKSTQTAANKPSGPAGPYYTRNTKKLEHQYNDKKKQADLAAKEVALSPKASHVSDPTISSASKQKEPLKKGTNVKQKKEQKVRTVNPIVGRSKSEKKKESKKEAKNSSHEEDIGPFGADEPTQQHIKTAKRHAIQDIFNNDDYFPEPQPEPQQEDDDKVGDENNRGKPSPKKGSKAPKSNASSTKSAITSGTGKKKNSASRNKEEDEDLEEQQSLEEEDTEHQKQQQQQQEKLSILANSTNPALPESSPLMQDTKAKSPSSSPSLRPRSESNDEKLPGATLTKKVKGKGKCKSKGVSDSTIFSRSRHILKPRNDTLSFEELKSIALEMLKIEEMEQECDWIFASRVQTNLWVCHRKLTHGFVKRFGLVHEDMPEKERHSSWTHFDSYTLRQTYGFEQIYVNSALKEKRETSIGTKAGAPAPKTGHSLNIVDQSLLSAITGQDITTARSSELGDHIPQNVISIPVQVPLPVLGSNILNFLKHSIRNNWTVTQLKFKFLKSGHQTIVDTIVENENTLIQLEKAVSEMNIICSSEEEQALVAKQKAERDELIRKMPKQPQFTTKVDNIFAEFGFDPTHTDQNSIVSGNNAVGRNIGTDSEF